MKRVKDYIYGPRRVPEELTVLRPVEIGGEKNSTELTDGAPGFHVVSTGYHRRDVCLRAVPTRLPSGILDREPDAAQLEGGKGLRVFGSRNRRCRQSPTACIFHYSPRSRRLREQIPDLLQSSIGKYPI